MSAIEGMPLVTPVSSTGDRFIGTDARPELLTNLVVDDEYRNAMTATLDRAGPGSVLSIPVRSEDLKDSMVQGLNTRQAAPLNFSESRNVFTAPDVSKAAIDHRVFGMGYVENFRSEKPPQGLNYLREHIKVPVDTGIPFNTPIVGPWNPFNVNANVLDGEPKFQTSTAAFRSL